MRLRKLGVQVLAVVAVAVLVTSCLFQEPLAPPAVRNAVDQNIEVFLVAFEDDGGDALALELSPGTTNTISPTLVSGCTKHTLVARTLDGTEVERRDPGLCEGEVWRVDGEPDE